tara:strand:- start:548 stop:1705 length:1158 start_codon:yes stop_codon:yes gene_type:complete
MNFKKFEESLKYKKYNKLKIFIRFIEYKLKNFGIDLIIKFNLFKIKSKPMIDLGSFKDNRFINFLLYSLKNDFILVYKKDENTKKLFKRIGLVNFFKHTLPNNQKQEKIKFKFSINKRICETNEVNFDVNYFKYIYNKKNTSLEKNLIMPYYMYPRIYNSFYEKIKIRMQPDFNLRVFFSGSVVEDGYKSFNWHKSPEKFPNRIQIINKILNEFKHEIFVIRNKSDLNSIEISKKKIIFCLHNKMIKKTSYILNFKKNFDFLSRSCFNLSCPGVVMPLCHHLIEGIKVGSIPITNCEELLYPNLNHEVSLQYSNLDNLIEKIDEALNMKDDEILFMRNKVLNFYKLHLSPETFLEKFQKLLLQNKKEIICCDDHGSVHAFKENKN